MNRLVEFFSHLLPRRSEGPLQRQVELFDTVLKGVGQLMWVDTPDKRRSILNIGEYEGLFGRSLDGMATDPQDWVKGIHPEDRDRVQAAFHLHWTGQFDIEYRALHPDGTVKWLHDRAFVIRDAGGNAIYQAGIVTDISRRVELEDQLRQNQKMGAVGELSAGICHDFNNVLAAILGNLELSLMADELSDDTRARLQAALDACDRGAQLTHRLLAYSRKQPLSPTAIAPGRFLHDLDRLLRPVLQEAVELEIVSGAGLWTCFADTAELETVLLNLAINARQAMLHPGKVTIEAHNARIDDEYAGVHDEVTPGQYVCFAVTDDGAGMPPDVVERAFDPFFTTKEAGKGSGLGLSMAYGFAKQSGGHIKIYSEPGEGTTVKLYLPRAASGETGKTAAPPEARRGSLAGLSVLVVENDAAVRAAVQSQLAAQGCQVTPADGADAALAQVSAGSPFDLLLLDVVLGGPTTGPLLAQQIRLITPDVPTVYMSGFTENAIIHGGRLDPDVILLQKPFTSDRLLSACLRALTPSRP